MSDEVYHGWFFGAVEIHDHALKHGLSSSSIIEALESPRVIQHRNAPREGEVLILGFTHELLPVQMIGVERPLGLLVIHAMAPPTPGFLKEAHVNLRGLL